MRDSIDPRVKTKKNITIIVIFPSVAYDPEG